MSAVDHVASNVEHASADHDARANHAQANNGQACKLSERDCEILALERVWWKYAGAKEQAIREKFDMSTTRYYQVLNELLDNQDALAFDPLLVKRLRRMRSARHSDRVARRLRTDL